MKLLFFQSLVVHDPMDVCITVNLVVATLFFAFSENQWCWRAKSDENDIARLCLPNNQFKVALFCDVTIKGRRQIENIMSMYGTDTLKAHLGVALGHLWRWHI
jgi:hypothetical protein